MIVFGVLNKFLQKIFQGKNVGVAAFIISIILIILFDSFMGSIIGDKSAYVPTNQEIMLS
ncbi:MAG: hypothetical protein IJZ71_04065 [Treponema sp.]|nr:hypothetical protein [Spirochaetaceae bacterium]MBQ8776633.1 hypothetical protein [Treponema sp.]